MSSRFFEYLLESNWQSRSDQMSLHRPNFKKWWWCINNSPESGYPHARSTHHPDTPPYPSSSVIMLCLFCWTYDDNVSVLSPTLARSLPIEYASRWSRSLVFLVRWSVICCQHGCYHGLAKGALPKEYLKVTLLTSAAWEDTRVSWCLSNPPFPGHYLSWLLGRFFVGIS